MFPIKKIFFSVIDKTMPLLHVRIIISKGFGTCVE